MFTPDPSKKPLKSCMKKCDTAGNSGLGYKNMSTACSSTSVATDFSVASSDSSQMNSPLSSSVFSYHSTGSSDYMSAYSSSVPKCGGDLDACKPMELEDEDDTYETQFDCEVECIKPYRSFRCEPRVFDTLCDEIEQDNRGRTQTRDHRRYSYHQLCQLRQQLELLERARMAGLKEGPLDLHDVKDMIDRMRHPESSH